VDKYTCKEKQQLILMERPGDGKPGLEWKHLKKDIIMEGVVEKKQKTLGLWGKRYLVLTHNAVEVRSGENDWSHYNSFHLGAITCNLQSGEKYPTHFDIIDGKNQHHFRTTHDDEAAAWSLAVRTAIQAQTGPKVRAQDRAPKSHLDSLGCDNEFLKALLGLRQQKYFKTRIAQKLERREAQILKNKVLGSIHATVQTIESSSIDNCKSLTKALQAKRPKSPVETPTSGTIGHNGWRPCSRSTSNCNAHRSSSRPRRGQRVPIAESKNSLEIYRWQLSHRKQIKAAEILEREQRRSADKINADLELNNIGHFSLEDGLTFRPEGMDKLSFCGIAQGIQTKRDITNDKILLFSKPKKTTTIISEDVWGKVGHAIAEKHGANKNHYARALADAAINATSDGQAFETSQSNSTQNTNRKDSEERNSSDDDCQDEMNDDSLARIRIMRAESRVEHSESHLRRQSAIMEQATKRADAFALKSLERQKTVKEALREEENLRAKTEKTNASKKQHLLVHKHHCEIENDLQHLLRPVRKREELLRHNVKAIASNTRVWTDPCSPAADAEILRETAALKNAQKMLFLASKERRRMEKQILKVQIAKERQLKHVDRVHTQAEESTFALVSAKQRSEEAEKASKVAEAKAVVMRKIANHEVAVFNALSSLTKEEKKAAAMLRSSRKSTKQRNEAYSNQVSTTRMTGDILRNCNTSRSSRHDRIQSGLSHLSNDRPPGLPVRLQKQELEVIESGKSGKRGRFIIPPLGTGHAAWAANANTLMR
jgi:hypothetical protein